MIPHQVIANYMRAFDPASSLHHEILAGADHALSRKAWRRQWGALLVDWAVKR